MTTKIVTGFALLALLAAVPALHAQAAADKPAAKTAKPPTAKDQNVKEYIALLRKDVKAEKSKLMGAVMQLDADDAAKFWPIYKEYTVELDKVNDLRVANILDYSQHYANLTDDKADELVRNAMQFQQQRNELLGKYYGRMKQELGAVTAARFLQVEHQLLLLIDLQIDSQLPIAGT
jgi:hypothetical protein